MPEPLVCVPERGRRRGSHPAPSAPASLGAPPSAAWVTIQAMADDEEVVKLLTEIRDLQVQALDRQNRFLWILVPIFAVLCVEVALMLVVT